MCENLTQNFQFHKIFYHLFLTNAGPLNSNSAGSCGLITLKKALGSHWVQMVLLYQTTVLLLKIGETYLQHIVLYIVLCGIYKLYNIVLYRVYCKWTDIKRFVPIETSIRACLNKFFNRFQEQNTCYVELRLNS